jgi:hypothetical protein
MAFEPGVDTSQGSSRSPVLFRGNPLGALHEAQIASNQMIEHKTDYNIPLAS